jgi:hypothetical protein
MQGINMMNETTSTKRPPAPTIPKPVGEAIELAHQVATGVDNHGVSLGLKMATGDQIRHLAKDLTDTETAFQASVAAQTREISPALKEANAEAAKFIQRAKKPISCVLGDRWSAAYVEVGFLHGHLRCPLRIAERVALLGRMAIFLKNHPECEAEKQGVTAARAEALYRQLSGAFQASSDHEVERRANRAARDAASRAMRKLVADVIVEVRRKLTAESTEWRAFGLQAPKSRSRASSAAASPAAPAGVTERGSSPAQVLKAA